MHPIRLPPLPVFRGNSDESAIAHIRRLEDFIAITRRDPDEFLVYVPTTLDETALLWWRTVEFVDTWDDFVAAFTAQFCSPTTQYNRQEELSRLRMTDCKNVDEYIRKVITIATEIEPRISQQRLKLHIMSGLPSGLRFFCMDAARLSVTEMAERIKWMVRESGYNEA